MRLRALVCGGHAHGLADDPEPWLRGIGEALIRGGHDVTFENVGAPIQDQDLGKIVRRLTALDTMTRYDLIVVERRRLALRLMDSPLAGRTWTCLTGLPEWAPGFGPGLRGDLNRLAAGSRYLLVQSEELRCALETAVPAAYGTCLVVPPAATDFRLEAIARRITGYLARAFPPPSQAIITPGGKRLRVGVTGHDLKFFTGLLKRFRARPNLDVRTVRWADFVTPSPQQSRELADWADVIICEWCGPNALWHARNKRPGQRLVVRLHRFELHTEWPVRLDINAVDRVVCVSQHYAEAVRTTTGWPREKIVVVPNGVDVDQLDRPKLPGAQFHIGMLGISPASKRLDLGLDVLDELRRRDPRFTLFVKSKLPWEIPWVWKKAEEADYFRRVFHRIGNQLPNGSVVFDSFAEDVASWLRGIGFILSTSDHESFHLAPAEGMASGAIPALLGWPGSETIYPPHRIHADPAVMAAAIAEIMEDGRFTSEGCSAQNEIRASCSLDKICEQWLSLIGKVVASGSGNGTVP